MLEMKSHLAKVAPRGLTWDPGLLGSDLHCCHRPTTTPSSNVEGETVVCLGGPTVSLLVLQGASPHLHQFYVGQGPGDAEVGVMTGWMADELRPTRGWEHNWDHLGLGGEWSWA